MTFRGARILAKPKTSSTIGLDIGSYSIKCVEILRSKDKFVLNQAALLPLGNQSADNLTEILKPLAGLIEAGKDHVRIVFSGSSLLVRCIQLPVMTQGELKSAIRYEAENHIAFPINDCILDFQIVSQNADKKIMNVLLVAAKRDFIQEKLRMLTDLGIHPEIIDVDIFSLVNAFEMLGANPNPEEKTTGLLNIGHRVSSFAILHENLPLFVREISLGSSGLEPLMEELKHSIDFFENEIQGSLQTVWLSGGGSLAPGAAEALAAALSKKVLPWGATQKIEMAASVDRKFFEENRAVFNIALGLALRS